MKDIIALSQNPLVAFLKKSPKDFTKADIIKFIEENQIQMINFRYVAGDGKLKALNFTITNRDYLEQILSTGERVDGSNIFPDFIHAGSSDLYVVPKFRTAFVDPFSEIPTLCFLCCYFNKDGKPMENSPEYILKKASDAFTKVTNMKFEAMGELEYYVIGDEIPLYETPDQKGYHESMPFVKFEQFRTECMLYIAKAGGLIKYGHSEVGNFTLDGRIYEQNEIEFLVCDVEDAADQLVIAKWIIRSLAYQYGLDVTFAPKITTGKAGSGLHVHTRIVKGGVNQMITKGELNSIAKSAIAGYLKCASSLTAFGNTNPTSYFRLVPHQEAPTSICWGDRNRSVLVRVPLGWTHKTDMIAEANPLEKPNTEDFSQKQTVEFRCPDGSADIYLLLAGLVVAARHGFEMEGALEFAKQTYVDVNIHSKENAEKMKKLEQLPASCWESADELSKHRHIFEKHGVFNTEMIDDIIKQLKSFNDKNIREEIKARPEMMVELVKKYFHTA
ncbi:glutamine synthetase family protein [Bacteroidales bacterium OttesenSCG-928-B11]|nr:glutamine synthetase family protein [Bacteroidales bacterium OttesenSCG-928-E04]MDL2307961.1 glutamine synthetase family protein [Bacteroidales bacterium OttesenSCG-928-C03]MDL2311678.1 glutamine synthetase family protein [Bacteroidales bacterium OttesenSCG-928-B11]MDL2325751.1 glutamine synthetase family protein [Bacteroidales bacterium OttesenSCG-928-A14]